MIKGSRQFVAAPLLPPTLLLLHLLFGPLPALGQASQDSSPSLCQPKADSAPSNPKSARLQGVILAPDERPPGVALTLVDSSSNRLIFSQFTSCKEKDGKSHGRSLYSVEIPAGTYRVSLSGSDYYSEQVRPLELKANDVRRLDFALREKQFNVIVLLPLLYLLSILLSRWNNIAKPSRAGLTAQLQDLTSQLPQGSALAGELKDWLTRFARLPDPLDWLFWSRGQEMTSWNLVHKAELALLKNITAAEVNARLATAQQQLLEIDKSSAKSLSARIAEELKRPKGEINKETRKQLLTEATGYIYDSKDTDYSSLTSWQNKAFWLTLVGVILIWAVAISAGHPAPAHQELFVAGAVGGFLSRLNRQLKRADVPTDYGASWSTLFLSPVAGAIAGWFGVALIIWLNHLGVLGHLLQIDWSDTSPIPMAAAFVLGFSERLFDGLVSQLEETIDKKKDDAKKTPPTKPPGASDGSGEAKPGIEDLDPAPVKPGDEVTAQPDNLDPAKVTAVALRSPTGADRPAEDVRAEGGAIKFKVPAATTPGSYQVILSTPDLTPSQIETGKQLTVTAAVTQPTPPQPGIKDLDAAPVKPGDEVTAQPDNLDPAKVTAVALRSPTGADKPAEDVRAEGGAIKFKVPADTTPGPYQVILSTPDLTPSQVETGKQLTVTAAVSQPPPPQPGIKDLDAAPVKPGDEVTAQPDNLDPAKVTAVALRSPTGADRPAEDVRAEGGAIKFKVPAATTPGSYQVVLSTPALTPPEIATGKQLTIV